MTQIETSRRAQPGRTGIDERHQRKCRSRDGGRCNCRPSYRAWVYDRRSGSKIRTTHSTLTAAKAWRVEALEALRGGRLSPALPRTMSQAAEAWLMGATAEPPTILTRSGRQYKPSVVRGYELGLRRHVLPQLGVKKLSDVRRGDLQALADRLLAEGCSASTVRNALMPVRAIYRHAIERDEVQVNPTSHLRLPTELGRRDRIATAADAAELLEALPEIDRALWATAFYAGLRLGELRALRWGDIDLENGVIRVGRSWDEKAGEVEPKSRKGHRRVPVTTTLAEGLREHGALTGRSGRDFVFGSKADRPFTPSHIRKRAAAAWDAANDVRAMEGLDPLEPIGFQECRHTFVSFMHDAGLSLERIGDYVGQSSSYMTDRYRHLLDGHEAEAARILDAYLTQAK